MNYRTKKLLICIIEVIFAICVVCVFLFSFKAGVYAVTATDFPYPEGGYTEFKGNGKFDYTTTITGEQGANGWFKLFGTVDSYKEMTKDASGTWHGEAPYCQIYGNQNIVAEKDDVILMWKAETAGTVVFDGAFFSLAEAPESDGVKIMMHRRVAEDQAAEELFSCEFPDGHTFGIDLSAENSESTVKGFIPTKFEVAAGEMIYFSFNCRGSSAYDNTFVWLYASFEPKETGGDPTAPDYSYPEGGYETLKAFGKFDYHANIGTEQGVNGWYKVYGNERSYSKMVYGKNYQMSGQEMWMGKGVYSMITNQQELTADGSNTIMLWQAVANGSVKFDGAIFKMGLSGKEEGFDGIRILIHQKKADGGLTKLFDETFMGNFAIDITDGDIQNTYDVKAGDMFLFSMNPVVTSSYDTVYTWLNAELSIDNDDPGTAPAGIGDTVNTDSEDPYLDYNKLKAFNAHNYTESIGEVQGSQNWYKLYGSVTEGYRQMQYDTEMGAWRGTSAVIYNKQDIIPYLGEDVILMWRAPFNGTVSFSGALFIMDVQTGDGVAVSIFNRKSLSESPKKIFEKSYSLSFAKQIDMTGLEVVAGEMYYFSINCKQTTDYDSTFTWLWAEFQKDEDNPGTAPGEDIGEATVTQEDFDSFFGTQQNHDGWYYLYGKADGKYYMMEYNEDSDWWAGMDAFCQIERRNQHPGNNDDAIRMWRAPADGTAVITLNVSGLEYGLGNGIKVLVHRRDITENGYSEAKLLWVKELTESGKIERYNAELSIKNGEMLFFSVSSLGANGNDSTILNVHVAFTKAADGVYPGDDIGIYKPLDITGWFGTTQGQNGWFYAYGSKDKYALSKYDASNERWIGDTDTQLILSGYQHPSDQFASIRIFVAGGTGKISLQGYAQKLQSEGEGVKAFIYHNGELLWSKDFMANDTDRIDLSFLSTIEVEKGDKLFFVVEPKTDNRYDMFVFGIQLKWVEKGEDFTDDDTELLSYLDPVDPFELKGGTNVEEEIPKENPDGKGGCSGTMNTVSVFSAICILFVSIMFFLAKRSKE